MAVNGLLFLGVYFIYTIVFAEVNAQKDEKECEVCVATLEKFRNQIPSGVEKNPTKLEAYFRAFCGDLPIGGKEYRFCYFVGGTADAATGTVMNVLRPMSYGLPSDKICHQLRVKDSQICELRYDVKPDFSKLNKMKVGEMRKILSMWGESMACAGCLEKADYIKAVRKLMPKYEPEEWEKLQAAERTEL